MWVHDDPGALDFTALAELGSAAWRHDYPQAVRIHYDERYLKWLLRGRDWRGLVVEDPAGRPVACLFTLLRTLEAGGRSFSTSYSTQWAVAPACRAAGIGLWLSYRAMQLVFETSRSDLMLGMFHEGHAAYRSLSGFDNNSAIQGLSIPLGAIWSKRLPGTATGSGAHEVKRVEQPDALAGHVGRTSARFAWDRSFARMYLEEQSPRSGTIWFASRAGALSFSFHALAVDENVLGIAGQIQCIHSALADAEAFAGALEAALSLFRQRGCIAACILDQGNVPHQTLREAGFEPSGDRLILGLCGAPETMRSLQSLSSPFSLDFL